VQVAARRNFMALITGFRDFFSAHP